MGEEKRKKIAKEKHFRCKTWHPGYRHTSKLGAWFCNFYHDFRLMLREAFDVPHSH